MYRSLPVLLIWRSRVYWAQLFGRNSFFTRLLMISSIDKASAAELEHRLERCRKYVGEGACRTTHSTGLTSLH
jgi:hypothetical protein